MKKCRICGVEKEIGEFYKRIDSPDGYRNECKKCCIKRNVVTKKEWRKRKGIEIKKICKWCGKNFETKFTTKIFCCRRCKDFYKDANPTEKRKQWKKEYAIRTRDRQRERSRTRYLEKKETYKNYSKKYSKTKKGREVARNNNNKRRTIYKETDITSDWLLELKENTSICILCNREMNEIRYHPQQKTLDHIKPINIEGAHMKNNVRFICFSCNNSRPKDGRDVLNKDLE